jgi:hypothetical protein
VVKEYYGAGLAGERAAKPNFFVLETWFST